MDAWLQSKLYRASGLDASLVRNRILQKCRNAGDFLCIVMEEICKQQGRRRWAENSPEGTLYLPTIKRLIPNALVVHIIRDGRDVAMSLGKLRYIRPLPWQDRIGLVTAGIYWEWIVNQARSYGRPLGPDYLEVHFEDLIANPQQTLDQVARFIDQPLDYKRIQSVAYGSLSKPNTSFRQETPGPTFSPVGRWKKGFSSDELLRFERIVGKTLQELGYTPATDGAKRGITFELRMTRWYYRRYFASKLWFKNSSLVRSLRPTLHASEIDQHVLADDHPPEVRA
jgi:hypothetical protein